MALISLGVWYAKNNSNRHWKKEAISTYVSSLDCFKAKGKAGSRDYVAQSCVSPPNRHGTSKKFFERVMIVLTPRREQARDNSKVFTISDVLPSKEKLQITKADLVSTTNPDAIKSSSVIEYRKSVSLLPKNSRIDVTSGSENEISSNIETSASSVSYTEKPTSPMKKEFGNVITEHIKNFQKPTKNFHGLRLKTELQFQHLDESPCSTSGLTPESNLDNSNDLEHSCPTSSHTTTPFYHKKPPPPPAPAQNLKPKF